MSEGNLRRTSGRPHLLWAVIVIGMVWGWFALEHFAGIDPRGRKVRHGDTVLPVWVPIVATPLIALGAFMRFRSVAGFSERAVRVKGRVSALGGGVVSGMRDVEYRYTFEGSDYSRRRSIGEERASRLGVDEEVDLLVDPRKPSRSRLAAEFED